MISQTAYWHTKCLNNPGGFDMDKSKIQFLVSLLMDSRMYFSMPLHDRRSRLSRLLYNSPSYYAPEVCDGDEDTDMGYESSWSEIFKTTRGVIDKDRH